MSYCRDCKYWQPDTDEAYTDKQTGSRHAPCPELTHGDADLIYFSDYQTYAEAQMITREDFGCVVWIPKP